VAAYQDFFRHFVRLTFLIPYHIDRQSCLFSYLRSQLLTSLSFLSYLFRPFSTNLPSYLHCLCLPVCLPIYQEAGLLPCNAPIVHKPTCFTIRQYDSLTSSMLPILSALSLTLPSCRKTPFSYVSSLLANTSYFH